MRWLDVCMAHWRADGATLQKRLPREVELDEYDGSAWLSVVPFRMEDVRMRGVPPLPGFRSIVELNLRTYVRLHGRSAVWFFSLDCDSPAVVRAARLTTGLPYFDARMTATQGNSGIDHASERVHRGAAQGKFRARYCGYGAPSVAAPNSLEAFLHERYYFANAHLGTIGLCRIRHDPWPMQPAEIEIAENTLADAIGHPLSSAPDSSYFARERVVLATPYWPVGRARKRLS
jgi:uncharacterized protein YqjF (DUF2071 family)